jgi:rhodanese-related sulfurtransferase
MDVPTITPGELEELRRSGREVELIDVRTPAEFRELHAEPARLVPLDRLDPEAVMRGRVGPVYTICRSGSRGRQAARRFQEAGFPEVANVEGGTLAWERAGLPVVRGKTAISLERQVRMAAGSLVLIGTALGAFVHAGFLAVPGLVGAGLVFAGATDWCGMGLLLARMPWNRAGAEGATCTGP